jgi:hypothetical protein
MHEVSFTRRYRLPKETTTAEAPAGTKTDVRASVLAILNEEDGFMCHDSSWHSDILKGLVAEGLAECEVRVGIPTYWKKS